MTETHPEKRLIGYARVSTYGQTLDAQLEQLRGAGCEKIFSIRSGDALIVWKLHRLASSMKQLFENYRASSGEGN
jgi:DNA invertase Pin-like site-specific DNA recombinase